MGQDLIIHLDYQKLIKRLRLVWKVKELLLTPHYYPYNEADRVSLVCNYTSEGYVESFCFILEGDGPIFLLANRTLLVASRVTRAFKWEGVGSVVNLNGLRLKVVAEYRNGFEYLVMLPNMWSAIFYYLFPISRWFDMIYRRLILTAAVWGLADCSSAEMPYWGNLKWSKEYKKAKEEK